MITQKQIEKRLAELLVQLADLPQIADNVDKHRSLRCHIQELQFVLGVKIGTLI